jgi:hypothetical protein
MKRGKKKAIVLGLSNLPTELRRSEHFARARGKHARGYLKFIARRGALATNAKRKAVAA